MLYKSMVILRITQQYMTHICIGCVDMANVRIGLNSYGTVNNTVVKCVADDNNGYHLISINNSGII